MNEQHGFKIEIEIIERGSFEEAFGAALSTAEKIFDDLDEAEIVVRQTGHSLFQGIPNGVYCEGCEGHTIPGVRWPTETNGDDSREWVERCDSCQRYESDDAAADRVREEYAGTGAPIESGLGVPAGKRNEQPYVNVGV